MLSVRHREAGLCTALARLGTTLAVIHAVLAALCSAAMARFRAERADGLHVFTAPGHRRSGEPADVGAFEIQSDAARHGFRVSLRQACRRALQACRSAFVACAKACFLDRVDHEIPCIGCTGSGWRASQPEHSVTVRQRTRQLEDCQSQRQGGPIQPLHRSEAAVSAPWSRRRCSLSAPPSMHLGIPPFYATQPNAVRSEDQNHR